MSTLISSPPLAINPSSTSTSRDADAKRITSSLSSSNSLSMASSLTTMDTVTTTTTMFGEVKGEGGDELENEVDMNEIPSVNANKERKIKIRHEDQVHAGRVEHVEHEARNLSKESASNSNTQSQIIDYTHSGLYTPTSSSISASGSRLESAPMPSPKSDAGVGSENSHMTGGTPTPLTTTTTTMATRQQHRKSVSVGGLSINSNVNNSKVHTRTSQQRQSRLGSVQLKTTLELDTKGLESLSQHLPDLLRQQQQLTINTPPEMLPPSPPLTNNELEMDDEGSERNVEENADPDEAQSQMQTTETSDVQDDEDEEDEEEEDGDGVNPQVEADIADGWQAPDSKLETTPGTPVLHSPSTTSLPSRVQESKFSLSMPISSPLALQSSDDVPHSNPLSRTTSPASPLSKYNEARSKSPKIKLSPIEFDLEKGEGDSVDQYIATSGIGNDAKRRVSIEKGASQGSEEEAGSSLGVTKTFEVIRPNKRYSSPRPPKSSYYIGPPTGPTPFGTAPTGQIGLHHPRDIVRIERDYDHGELVQFSSAYPLEFEGRITPTQFLETINAINERLISAHSLTGAFIFNLLAILTFWISPFFIKSKYEKEMRNLQILVDALNAELYNPQGLNILWPRRNAFLFLEIEYYIS
ncbi:hypothetical protein Clacol_003093 [Clathrus columnatus]|uniref:Ras modification protein ERF4 n=1 Tax=Clathrus columnatus TaxID=1419009 RepID=A0AAV5A6M3_9AGAM|nr:hypothetical protein Clacol_003093 [Clathrus columnatus]